ncbi:MAG: hypothetical protein J6O88_10350 [Chryseobacterium sp.]|uniref:hypothetical protein n=1 Tax=Chryseobacterium sp. TaxID=1871047 RepID=UPI001B0F9390|nr:hypothetical protein [Chryseobacterium sp.]MBO6185067.1 hypothetical protein [Chryseobacterium sp.]
MKSLSKYIPLLLTLIVFFQNPIWIFWNVGMYGIAICSILLFLILNKRIERQRHSYKTKIFPITFYISFFIFFMSLYEIRLSSVFFLFILICLPIISNEEKNKTLNLITTVLCVIVSVSLVPWFINTFLYKLSWGYEMYYADWKGDDGKTVLTNYYLFVQAKHDFIIRFYSLFDEPGVLGTLGAFVLIANRFNFRDKRNIVILIGCIFTFSLAFYVLVSIGLILLSKISFKNIFFGGLFVLPVLYFLLGNETFNTSIIDRANNYDDSSIESRTSGALNQFFDEYVTTIDFILGKGLKFFSENKAMSGQGYKFFLIEYGLLGFVILLLIYISFIKNYNRQSFWVLFIFLISFLQRPSLFTPWCLIIFVLAISQYERLPVIKPKHISK